MKKDVLNLYLEKEGGIINSKCIIVFHNLYIEYLNDFMQYKGSYINCDFEKKNSCLPAYCEFL